MCYVGLHLKYDWMFIKSSQLNCVASQYQQAVCLLPNCIIVFGCAHMSAGILLLAQTLSFCPVCCLGGSSFIQQSEMSLMGNKG